MKGETMTKKQFLAACKRRGYEPQGFCGYVRVISYESGGGMQVSYENAPEQSWSCRLAYLIKEERRWRRKMKEETATK